MMFFSKKIIIIVFSSFFFAQSTVNSIEKIKLESGAVLLDLSDMDLEEKKDVLRSIMKKSNKFIFHMSTHGLEVYQIVSMQGANVNVELMDSWWWNRPKKPIYYNVFPNEKNLEEPSLVHEIPIRDIFAIQILKKNSLSFLLLPVLIAVILMEVLAL